MLAAKQWLDLDKNTIFTGKDENGNLYLNQFLRLYQEVFQPEAQLRPGCPSCLEDYYKKLIKYLSTMSKVKSMKPKGWKLKQKYEGITLKFGSKIRVTNANVNEYGPELYRTHKRAEILFESIPDDFDKDGTGAEDKPLTVAQTEKLGAEKLKALVEKHAGTITAAGTKLEDLTNNKLRAKAIVAALAAEATAAAEAAAGGDDGNGTEGKTVGNRPDDRSPEEIAAAEAAAAGGGSDEEE